MIAVEGNPNWRNAEKFSQAQLSMQQYGSVKIGIELIEVSLKIKLT
jgi:hypothetical protein